MLVVTIPLFLHPAHPPPLYKEDSLMKKNLCFKVTHELTTVTDSSNCHHNSQLHHSGQPKPGMISLGHGNRYNRTCEPFWCGLLIKQRLQPDNCLLLKRDHIFFINQPLKYPDIKDYQEWQFNKIRGVASRKRSKSTHDSRIQITGETGMMAKCFW